MFLTGKEKVKMKKYKVGVITLPADIAMPPQISDLGHLGYLGAGLTSYSPDEVLDQTPGDRSYVRSIDGHVIGTLPFSDYADTTAFTSAVFTYWLVNSGMIHKHLYFDTTGICAYTLGCIVRLFENDEGILADKCLDMFHNSQTKLFIRDMEMFDTHVVWVKPQFGILTYTITEDYRVCLPV